jgi:hypothetical protein
MKLSELTNVQSLETAQSITLKGGARDTRTSTSTGTSTLTLIIKK